MSIEDMLYQLAVESGQIDQRIEIGDDDILEMSQESVSHAFEQIDRGFGLIQSIQTLSGHFVTVGDVSQESLHNYQVSVHSAIQAAGLKIPTSLIVPSFESDNVKSSAAVKKVGIIRKIIDWIKTAVKTILSGLKRLFGLTKMEFVKNSDNLKQLKARLLKIPTNAKPVKNIKFEGSPRTEVEAIGGDVSQIVSFLHKSASESPAFVADIGKSIALLANQTPTKDQNQRYFIDLFFKNMAHKRFLGYLEIEIDEALLTLKRVKEEKILEIKPLPVPQMLDACNTLIKINEDFAKSIEDLELDVVRAIGKFSDKVKQYEKDSGAAWEFLKDTVDNPSEDKPTSGKEFWDKFDEINKDSDELKGYQELSRVFSNATTWLLTSMHKGLRKQVMQGLNVLDTMAIQYKVEEKDAI